MLIYLLDAHLYKSAYLLLIHYHSLYYHSKMPPKPKNKAPTSPVLSDSSECVQINSEEFYVVQSIYSKKIENGKEFYLIKWKGWNRPQDLTWQPIEHLQSVKELINQFNDKQKKKQKQNPREGQTQKAREITQSKTQQAPKPAAKSKVEVKRQPKIDMRDEKDDSPEERNKSEKKKKEVSKKKVLIPAIKQSESSVQESESQSESERSPVGSQIKAEPKKRGRKKGTKNKPKAETLKHEPKQKQKQATIQQFKMSRLQIEQNSFSSFMHPSQSIGLVNFQIYRNNQLMYDVDVVNDKDQVVGTMLVSKEDLMNSKWRKNLEDYIREQEADTLARVKGEEEREFNSMDQE